MGRWGGQHLTVKHNSEPAARVGGVLPTDRVQAGGHIFESGNPLVFKLNVHAPAAGGHALTAAFLGVRGCCNIVTAELNTTQDVLFGTVGGAGHNRFSGILVFSILIMSGGAVLRLVFFLQLGGNPVLIRVVFRFRVRFGELIVRGAALLRGCRAWT